MPDWGGRPVERGAPILLGSEADVLTRLSTLRLGRLTRALPWSPHIEGVFAPGALEDARLGVCQVHRLGQQLVDEVLPGLRRTLRCETQRRSTWMRHPAGGRVDALATMRQHPIGPPSAWRVVRTERWADSPVNRWASAVLRATSQALDTERRLLSRWRLPTERGLVEACGRALDHFLGHHPIGGLPLAGPPARHLAAAQQRRAEFRRLAPLHRWWGDFAKVDLAALRSIDRDNLIEDWNPGDCYESTVGLVVLAGLQAEHGLDANLKATVGGASVQVILEEPLADADAPTLRLRTATREVVLEARNARPRGRWASFVRLACAATSKVPLLVTPTRDVDAVDHLHVSAQGLWRSPDQVGRHLVSQLRVRLAATDG